MAKGPKPKATPKPKAKAKAKGKSQGKTSGAECPEDITAIVPALKFDMGLQFHRGVSKMRGMLKYRSSAKCVKATPAEREEALRALAKYDLLTDHDERQRFLKDFEEHGSGQGKDSLKFASSFQKALEYTDDVKLGQVENYFTPGEILAMNGQALANFKNIPAAIEDCEYLVRKSMELHGWKEEDHPPQKDEVKPEYSRYWYVKGKGKETSWTQTQSKKLTGDAALKGVAQLQGACKAMEMLGWTEEPAEASGASIENVKYSLLIKEIELLKST